MSGLVGGNIVTDKLSFYIDFANPKSYIGSGSTVIDMIRGYTGTINGTPSLQSDYKGNLRLDGSTNYIDVNGWDNTQTSNKITVEMYARERYEAGSGFEMLFGFNLYDVGFVNSYASGNGFGFNTGNGDIYGISLASATSLNLIGTGQIHWHHYTFVFDEVSYVNNKIYVDGSQLSLSQIRNSQNLAGTIIGTNFRIGGWRASTGTEANADISYVRLYNKELTSTEIQQNYNSIKGRFI